MKILGIQFDVNTKFSSSELSKKYNFDDRVLGIYDQKENMIYIANDQDENNKRITLTHELIEMINSNFRVGIAPHHKIEKLGKVVCQLLEELNFDFSIFGLDKS